MRTLSHRTFWLSAATLLVVTVIGGWLLAPRNRVTLANFDRIQKGMTHEDVERLLGQQRLKQFPTVHDGESMKVDVWQNGWNFIVVYFDSGRVHSKVAGFPRSWEEYEYLTRDISLHRHLDEPP